MTNKKDFFPKNYSRTRLNKQKKKKKKKKLVAKPIFYIHLLPAHDFSKLSLIEAYNTYHNFDMICLS